MQRAARPHGAASPGLRRVVAVVGKRDADAWKVGHHKLSDWKDKHYYHCCFVPAWQNLFSSLSPSIKTYSADVYIVVHNALSYGGEGMTYRIQLYLISLLELAEITIVKLG